MRPVQQGLGGGRCAVRSRHGQKGGGGRRGWDGDEGRWLLLQRGDDGSGVSLRDTESLGQGGQRAGGGIAEGAQGRQQHGQEDVDPLIGFALAHAEEASLDHLQGVRLHISENKQQPILRGR